MGDANEVLNERAVTVMRRMSDKLTGRDFMQDGLLGEQPCRHMPARIDCTYTLYIYRADCWQDRAQAQAPFASSRTMHNWLPGQQQRKPSARPHSRHRPWASSCTLRAALLGERQHRAVAQPKRAPSAWPVLSFTWQLSLQGAAICPWA